jgi:hypothetical protein
MIGVKFAPIANAPPAEQHSGGDVLNDLLNNGSHIVYARLPDGNRYRLCNLREFIESDRDGRAKILTEGKLLMKRDHATALALVLGLQENAGEASGSSSCVDARLLLTELDNLLSPPPPTSHTSVPQKYSVLEPEDGALGNNRADGVVDIILDGLIPSHVTTMWTCPDCNMGRMGRISAVKHVGLFHRVLTETSAQALGFETPHTLIDDLTKYFNVTEKGRLSDANRTDKKYTCLLCRHTTFHSAAKAWEHLIGEHACAP